MLNSLFEPPALETRLMATGLPGGGSRIQDRSAQAQPGVITGAVWKRLPTGLWYLSLDGVDDGIDCGNHPSLNVTDRLTVKLWVLPETQNFSTVWVVGKDTAGGRSFAYGLSSSYYLWGQHSGTNVGSSAIALTPVKWHQVVYTYASDAATFSFYINGMLDRTIASPPAISASNSNLYLGRRGYAGAEGYYKGGIALVEIQRKSWCPLEVQNSFNREKSLFGVW